MDVRLISDTLYSSSINYFTPHGVTWPSQGVAPLSLKTINPCLPNITISSIVLLAEGKGFVKYLQSLINLFFIKHHPVEDSREFLSFKNPSQQFVETIREVSTGLLKIATFFAWVNRDQQQSTEVNSLLNPLVGAAL